VDVGAVGSARTRSRSCTTSPSMKGQGLDPHGHVKRDLPVLRQHIGFWAFLPERSRAGSGLSDHPRARGTLLRSDERSRSPDFRGSRSSDLAFNFTGNAQQGRGVFVGPRGERIGSGERAVVAGRVVHVDAEGEAGRAFGREAAEAERVGRDGPVMVDTERGAGCGWR